MAITATITDPPYNCPTNGTSDARAAFLAFRADAAGQVATLNLPAVGASAYYFDPASALTNDYYDLFKGIPDLTVNMTGVTLKGAFTAGAGNPMPGTAGTFAKVNSVFVGASSVTCKTASDANNFTVGNYACLMGFDTQGLWSSSYGSPPNNHFFEFVRILSKNGTSGVVTFTAPIANSYLDTWPQYAAGQYPDQGGPATLFAIDANWDCSLKFNGGQFEAPSQAINCPGRAVTFRNYTQNGYCVNPSLNQSMRFIDSTLGFIEVDKLVGTLSFEGTTTTGQVHNQSSSVDLIYLTGTANITSLNGTPKKLKVDPGVVIGTLLVGCTNGRTDEIYLDNCIVGAVTLPGGILSKGPSDAGFQVYSMSNGVITIPNTDNAQRWVVPGTWCYWTGTYDTETSFKVVSVTQDATNIYIQTSLPFGFPSVPLTTGKLYLTVHPAPKATFVNCTGCAEVVDWSQFGTMPFASKSRRTYTKTLTTTPDNIHVPGKVLSITYTVNTAFAGTQDPLTLKAASFDNVKTLGPPSSYTAADYGPKIDLRTTGTRTITASGVSPPGGLGADATLTLPNANTWLTGAYSSVCSNNVSADPSNFSVTVEIITDQGPFPPVVAPLQFRLHA